MRRGSKVKGIPILLACLSTVFGAILLASPAEAHPLGNFTRNTYVGFTISPGSITADHVLDLAEIPSYQERDSIDTDGNGSVSEEEADEWGKERCEVNATKIQANTDIGPVVWGLKNFSLTFPPGQGGLSLTRLECLYTASTSGANSFDATVEIESGSGWRELTAVGDGVILTSDVPSESSSKRLTQYPSYAAAFDYSTISATWVIGEPAPTASPEATVSSEEAVLESYLPFGLDSSAHNFTDLISEKDLTFWFVLLAIFISMFLGGLHALAPGHGKTMMAASLLSTNGRKRDAVILGTSVTVSHTAGVIIFAVTLSIFSSFAAASAYPWLGFAGGILAIVVGIGLLRQARRNLREKEVSDAHPHLHSHSHEGEDSHHDVSPLEPHVHDEEAIYGAATTTRAVPGYRRLIALGLAGGIVPSPSAIIVLLAGFALGRSWFALLLVLFYGIGMAIALCVTGLLLVHAGRFSQRVAAGENVHRHVKTTFRFLPAVAAVIVILAGAWVAVRSIVMM